MPARLSAAKARALGLTPPPPAKATRTRREANGPQRARCHTCGAILEGETAAARHNTETHHARFDLVP